MMGVLVYVVLDEVAFGLERKLVCPASRVVCWRRRCKTSSTPRGKMETRNMRPGDARVTEIFRGATLLRVEGLMRSSCFATLAVVQKPNQLSSRPNPSSLFLASLYSKLNRLLPRPPGCRILSTRSTCLMIKLLSLITAAVSLMIDAYFQPRPLFPRCLLYASQPKPATFNDAT